MGIQESLATIDALVDELGKTYTTQAELVAVEMEAQENIISAFHQWQCDDDHWTRDTPPSRWNKMRHLSIHERPHPDQWKARQEVENAAAEYNDTATAQMDRKEQLATIPSDLGGFLTDWLSVDTSFSSIYYPSNTDEIPAGREGWLGGAASRYSSAVGSQRTAAEKTRGVVGDLVSNSSSFLGHITDLMGNLTELALAQEQIYLDQLKALMIDPTSIGSYISAAKDVVQLIQDERVLYFQRVDEQGQMLADAVDTVIQTQLLENDLVEIGPNGDWPRAKNVSEAEDNPASVTQDELVVDARWFGEHIDFWKDIQKSMGTLSNDARGAKKLPIKIVDMPHFSAVQSNALNKLAESLADAITGGRDAAGNMAYQLRRSITTYLENEAENAALADKIYDDYIGN